MKRSLYGLGRKERKEYLSQVKSYECITFSLLNFCFFTGPILKAKAIEHHKMLSEARGDQPMKEFVASEGWYGDFLSGMAFDNLAYKVRNYQRTSLLQSISSPPSKPSSKRITTPLTKSLTVMRPGYIISFYPRKPWHLTLKSLPMVGRVRRNE